VLVVDDHEDTRDLIYTMLKTEGYDVVLAADGEEALRCFRAQPAEIVLLDMLMPRKDGLATIRELRQFPGVTIVAMSGDGVTEFRDMLAEARTAGAQLSLRKPLEPWVVLRTLEGIVAGRRSLRPVNGLGRTA
jgi:CheY-like chemotaxis protein